jgi:hypothetical protein
MQVTRNSTEMHFKIIMKKIITFIFICIALTTFVQTSFAQSVKNEQALINIQNSVYQEQREFLTILKNLGGNERTYASEIYSEYQVTWQLLDHFNDILNLYSIIEKQKKLTSKKLMRNYKEYYLSYTSTSIDSLLLQQSNTKLPVINDYAEKLKKHLKESQNIVSTFEF